MNDEILLILDSEQADVITFALRELRTRIYEGGINGIRNDCHVQFVDNLIYYIEGRKQQILISHYKK